MNVPLLMAVSLGLSVLATPAALAQNSSTPAASAPESTAENKAQQAKALITQARAARKKGDLDRTAALLLRAFAIDPKPVLLNNLGKIYEEMGRYDLAYATYKRVVDDPNTSQKLRDLDKERMARIYEKLTATLVLVPNTVTWSQVWINSKGYPMGSGIELSVPSGPLMIDIFDAKSTVVVRLDVNGPAGRRLILNTELTKGIDKRFGVMSWDRANRKLKQIRIDDVPVQASLKKAKGVQIAPGQYQVELEWVGEEATQLDVDIKAGMLIELKPPVKKVAAAPVAPVTVLAPVKPATPTPAPVVMSPPPEVVTSTSDTRWRLIAAQVTTVALGLGVGTWGYTEYAAGNEELETIRSEQTGLAINAPGALSAYREWNRRNEDAAAQANRGQIAMGLGGLTTLAGLIWVLSLDYAVPATALNIDQPSLAIGGEF